ncbi:Hypothetical_protein [Hexamita inflata]|uniref:Hypothetical_protein n=1 Tax=Hexamita inflata TaxID=28002 RepID=A0AA86UEB1_9EUKA|nr:Hypothetical protein HINF_LOCUS42390 [Hexamita inflata]
MITSVQFYLAFGDQHFIHHLMWKNIIFHQQQQRSISSKNKVRIPTFILLLKSTFIKNPQNRILGYFHAVHSSGKHRRYCQYTYNCYYIVLRVRLNISQFCWEKVQVLLGVWRYWEISGFCAGKQPAIISNKNIKNKNWEIPSKKQTYQT